MQEIKKIVVIGPESTGKSSLSAALANYFNTLWCPEYAREYLIKNGKVYQYKDLLEIAKGQIALEDEMYNRSQKSKQQCNSNLLFIDTDLYVMKVWCEVVYNQCHAYILEQIAQRKYDLYLLCNIDLPWEADELRECPDEQSRSELFNIYLDILVQQNTPFFIVEGKGDKRIENAINAVKKIILN